MLYSFITGLLFAEEFLFLQPRVSGHAGLLVAAREFEHGEVEGVESCQSDELELVAHGGKLALEAGDGRVVQILLPVERGRAVVG